MKLEQYRQLLRDKMDGKAPVKVKVTEKDGKQWTGELRDFSSLDYVDYGNEDQSSWTKTDFTDFHLKQGFDKFIVYVVPEPPAAVKTHWPSYEQVEVIE